MSELDLLNGDLVGHELFYFYCQDILLKFISVDEERHRFHMIYLSADNTTLLLTTIAVVLITSLCFDYNYIIKISLAVYNFMYCYILYIRKILLSLASRNVNCLFIIQEIPTLI